MNPRALPERCEVLVIGAGPAGSACAQLLSRAGVQVVLVDQHDFPRDKTCGDGLIPDAHAALERLGVLQTVLGLAQGATAVRCFAPSGRSVDVLGTLAVLPRRELDHILVKAAQSAGADVHTPWRFESLLTDAAGRACGARLRRSASADREMAEVAAKHVVVATGATANGLIAAGMCERQYPSAMGLRGYVQHPGMPEQLGQLQVAWHRKLLSGYGWIFPCGPQRFNIGVAIVNSHGRASGQQGNAMRSINLRQVFQDFCELHAPARELMRGGQLLGDLKGAPLRCSLSGASFAKPGILVTGEAAGSTYAMSGEGIGKAMETGMLAAESLIQARQGRWQDDELSQHYTLAMGRLKPKFDLYEKGDRLNRMPWLTELLIRRAASSAKLRQRMSLFLEEKSSPAQLVTLRGLYKLMVE